MHGGIPAALFSVLKSVRRKTAPGSRQGRRVSGGTEHPPHRQAECAGVAWSPDVMSRSLKCQKSSSRGVGPRGGKPDGCMLVSGRRSFRKLACVPVVRWRASVNQERFGGRSADGHRLGCVSVAMSNATAVPKSPSTDIDPTLASNAGSGHRGDEPFDLPGGCRISRDPVADEPDGMHDRGVVASAERPSDGMQTAS